MFDLFDPKADVRIEKGTNLPHWFQPGVTYFVTFRTADSIPLEVARAWHAARGAWLANHGVDASASNWQRDFDALAESLRRQFHELFSRRYLESLDRGYGACVLRQSELSGMVAESLLHFDGQRYHLGDFVVMPNHVHVIVCLLGNTEIEAQCKSWKRFSATQINRRLERTGRFWQEESFDHLIRSTEQFTAVERYIAVNPQSLKQGEYFYYQRNRVAPK